MLLLSLFLPSPTNVVVVSTLGFPLADKVDVVADSLAAANVLPLPNVLPRVPQHDAVLVSICGGLASNPARVVAVRAPIAPHPGALPLCLVTAVCTAVFWFAVVITANLKSPSFLHRVSASLQLLCPFLKI